MEFMKLTEAAKTPARETAGSLKGYERRLFMARMVRALGPGGQNLAEREFGWSGQTIRKGEHELKSGMECVDGRRGRGQKPAEEIFPNLLADIKTIVDGQSQTDPQFRNQRLYTRLSAAEVRRQLVAHHGYDEATVPCGETIRVKLNLLGYHPSRVAKTKPKIPQTDAIFDAVNSAKEEATLSAKELLASVDTKAVVKVGEFSRNGTTRVATKALDHDFNADARVTPVGILLPQHDDLRIFMATSKATSDCIVDCVDMWWADVRLRFPEVERLTLLQDNGPENSGRRTQFLKRMVDFVHDHHIDVRLATYPPYHSKYNPIERCWGALEKHWNGSLLDTVNTVVEFAKTMTWKGAHPVITLVTKTYAAGVKLSKTAMKAVEAQLRRRDGLEPWFVDIRRQPHSG